MSSLPLGHVIRALGYMPRFFFFFSGLFLCRSYSSCELWRLRIEGEIQSFQGSLVIVYLGLQSWLSRSEFRGNICSTGTWTLLNPKPGTETRTPGLCVASSQRLGSLTCSGVNGPTPQTLIGFPKILV